MTLGRSRLRIAVAVLAYALLLTVESSIARAEARFDAPLLLHPGRGPLSEPYPQRWNIALGDLDLDDCLDIVSPMYDSLAVYLGRGDGTLRAPLRVPIAARTERPVIADFDADGFPDLAYGGQHRVEVLFGDGTASQWTRSTLATSDEVSAIVAGDFDGDHVADLLSLSQDAGGIRWIRTYLARSGRTFLERSEVQADAWPWPMCLRAADVNEDGRADVLAANGYEPLRIWLSDGDGTFTLRSSIAQPAWGLDLGDIDGDSHLDLVIAPRGPPRLLLGHGDGTFEAPVVIPGTYSAFDVAIGDLDGDSLLDVAYVPPSSTPSGSSIFTKLGTGGGGFGESHALPTSCGWNPIALADLDGDERLDFIGIAWDVLVTVLGDGRGGFRRNPDGEIAPQISSAITADVDADGDDDVIAIIGSGTSSKLQVGLGAGSRSLSWFAPIAVPDLYFGVVVAADFDVDGRLDLVALLTGGRIAWLQGRGDGGFETPSIQPLPGLDWNLQVGDATGDGIPDLVYPAGTSLRVARGDGLGRFDVILDSPISTTGNPLWWVSLGDLDGDGVLDAATSDRWSDGFASDVTLYLALGDGSGSFARTVLGRYLRVGGNWRILVGDVNGDGRDDLVTFDPSCGICHAKGKVAVRLQQPGGTLGSPIESAGPELVYELRDLNRDGRADLLGTWSAGIAVLDGNADGSLAPLQGYGSRSGIMAIGDLDGDQRPDLLSRPDWNGSTVVLPIHFGRESTGPTVSSIGPAGATLAVGETRTIDWAATDDSAMGSVDLFVSRHGRRGPFERIAFDLPNTGSHSWNVTGPPSDSVAIKIVARDAADNVTWRVTDPLGRIVEGVAGTTPRSPASGLAISRVEPNPAHRHLRVGMTLPATGRVRLALYDLSGRRVALLSDGARVAGSSTIESDLPSLEAGLYFLRLDAAGHSVTARVALLR